MAALKDAEAARDKKAKDTQGMREAGARAQAEVDKLDNEVHELNVAIDMLERPERFVERVTEEAQRAHGVDLAYPQLTPEAYERPEVEEMHVAGVKIVRRPADA